MGILIDAIPIIAFVGVIIFIENTESIKEKKMNENAFTLRHTKFWLWIGICFLVGTYFIVRSAFRDYGELSEITHYLFPLIIFLIGLFAVLYYFSLIVKIKDEELTIRKNIFTRYTITFSQITSIKIKMKMVTEGRNIISVFSGDQHHFSFDTKYFVGANMLLSRLEKEQTIKFIW